MKFSPEFLVLRQFHSAVIKAIIHAILWRIIKPIQRRGNWQKTIRAIDWINFYPFCVSWDMSNGVIQIYERDEHEDSFFES